MNATHSFIGDFFFQIKFVLRSQNHNSVGIIFIARYIQLYIPSSPNSITLVYIPRRLPKWPIGKTHNRLSSIRWSIYLPNSLVGKTRFLHSFTMFVTTPILHALFYILPSLMLFTTPRGYLPISQLQNTPFPALHHFFNYPPTSLSLIISIAYLLAQLPLLKRHDISFSPRS